MLEVGQMPTAEANYRQDARWELPAVLVPGHMCHPEWYATGEPWPTELPPTKYSPGGIPECCGLFVDPTEGGIELGGEAGDVAGFIPGDNCPDAAVIAQDVTYAGEYPGGTAEQWWRIDPLVPIGTYHIEVTGTEPTVRVSLLRGLACTLEIDRYVGTFALPCGSATFNASGLKSLYVKIGDIGEVRPAASYTIRVGTGPC